jgi:NDP-sugar pyrophosphorylase family protein
MTTAELGRYTAIHAESSERNKTNTVHYGIILAGGNGTRLMPLTQDRPKPMVEIAGAPILEHQIRQLKRGGIENIIILESYKHEIIQDYFSDGENFGVRIKHLVLPQELKSAGAIKSALENIPEEERDVLILYGDNISNVDIDAVIKRHTQNSAFLITAVTVEKLSPFGEWNVDNTGGRIQSFREKPNHVTNTGIFLVNRGIADFLADGKDFFGEVVQVISSQGGGVFQTYKHNGFWEDIADLDRLKAAECARAEWKLP